MANPYRDKKGQFSSGGSGGGKGAAKGTGGKSSGTITVRFPKAKKTPENEAAQLKRDRQQVKMSASTTGKIYPKDGSRSGTSAENKTVRDKEAASARRLREQFAKRAKALPPELAASARLSKPTPSKNAMALAKGLAAKPPKAKPAKPRKAKPAKARSFSKAERLRMTDARFGSRGSKADRMMDTF